MINVIQAGAEQIEQLATLFDKYREFYGQTSDLAGAKQFLQQRMQNQQSIIFAAQQNQQLVGFVQLYPVFSSISMQRSLILNDLYVLQEARKQGVAVALMDAARDYARSTGAKGLELATQNTNTAAQKLYESLGYEKDTDFYHYFLSTQ